MFTWEPFKLFHHAEYNQISDTTYMIAARNGYNIQYGIIDLKDYAIDEYKTMLIQSNLANKMQSLDADDQLQTLAFIAFIGNTYKDTYFHSPADKNMDYKDVKFNLEHYAGKVLDIDVWKEHVKEQKIEVDAIRKCLQECTVAIDKFNEENKDKWSKNTANQPVK